MIIVEDTTNMIEIVKSLVDKGLKFNAKFWDGCWQIEVYS